MKVAYIRVSTEEQSTGRQVEAMKNLGIERWYEEKISGKDQNRPELIAMLDYVRAPDIIYIKDFSRLARSTKDLLEIIEQLAAKNVTLISLKENIDSSTTTGKLLLTMIGAINEFERTNMLERQREGIALAKKNGAYKGRKKIEFPHDWMKFYSKWQEKEITAKVAMENLGIKRTTFYKLVKEQEGA